MELIEVNPLFAELAQKNGFYSDDLMKGIAQEGTVSHIDAIPADIRRIWVCAHDIEYLWHVRMQAAFQRHIDNAVSKTINFPFEATPSQVSQSYMAAWDLGLKGITVYRDRSRSGQVLNIQAKKSSLVGLPGTVTSPSIHGALALQKAPLVAPVAEGDILRICGKVCPQCGAEAENTLKFEGCSLCPDCGYTSC